MLPSGGITDLPVVCIKSFLDANDFILRVGRTEAWLHLDLVHRVRDVWEALEVEVVIFSETSNAIVEGYPAN